MRTTLLRSRPAREAAPSPPRRLLRLHRHSLSHVLVLGGRADERARAALAFHRTSPLRLGPFVRVECGRDEARVVLSLRSWLAGGEAAAGACPLRAAERGMLFLDDVDRLSTPAQRLLLAFVARRLDPTRGADPDSWGGRLAAGTAENLDFAAARGTFLPALYDCLDKVRIELDGLRHGGAA